MIETFKARKWQTKAFKVVDVCSRFANDIVPVNACVGSGKTSVACYSFGKFIVDNRDKNTVQMFVTPRIRLCDQQNKEIESFLESEFNLKNGPDYVLIGVDCTKHQFNKKNDLLESRHTIFVICDESLWGKDKGIDPMGRWHSWTRKFKAWCGKGFAFGFCALDEAHNYESNEKLIRNDENECLATWFNIMPMSGTPAAYQREWSKEFRHNVCSCSPKEAMENGWICKPTLNLVQGDRDKGWARAIVAVLNREIIVCKEEVFMPRIMVNCSGIDDIKHLIDLPWIRERAGKDFHMVTLHSTKGYSDDGVLAFAKPTIDCVEVEADEAYNAIEKIDSNGYFKDKLPIVVCQVQMLGEGINVSSFNACLTASNSDKTAMQQMGRIIRNYSYEGKSKVEDGHANVYVLTDNIFSIKNLLLNLEEYDLTDECFRWGDKIDIMTGSGLDENENFSIPELNGVAWDPIDPEHDLDIIEMMQSMKSKLYKKAAVDMFSSIFGDNDGDGKADVEELDNLLETLSNSGMMKLWSSHVFKKNELASERKEKTEKAKDGSKSNNSSVSNKVEVKKSNPTYDVFMKWLFDIRHALRTSSSMKKIWSIDKTLCIETILQNKDVADFLVSHISSEKLDKLTK